MRDYSFMANPLATFLGGIFRIQPDTQGMASPGRKDPKTGKVSGFKALPPQIQKIWAWWFQENYTDRQTAAMRWARYNELDFMARNDSIVAPALNLYADEIVQADSPNGVLTVNARNAKTANTLTEILRSWGMNQEKLRVIAYDMMKYGDAFTVKGISPRLGITSQTVLDPNDVADRMEFSATRFDIQKYAGGQDAISRSAKLKKIGDFLKGTSMDMTEVSEFFQSYLFGFTMRNGLILPPWMVSHFRIQTTQKEIWPFGNSDFSYSLSTFRQLVASKNLQAVARVLSMPMELYKVKTNEEMTPDELWELVQDVKTEMDNAGRTSSVRDDMGLSNRLFAPMDLLEIDIKDRSHDLDKIADIEYLRDDLIMSTLIPKGYLIVDKASFGTSGASLLQQYKPFGRRVFGRQSIIMKELAQDLRIHCAITGQLEGLDTEFELEMNFPQIEESRDRIQQKGDTFRLAKDVYDGLKDITGADSLDPETTKQIFSNLSFLSPKEVDSWIDETLRFKTEIDAKAGSDSKQDAMDESRRRTRNRNMLTEEVVQTVYFDAKKNRGLGEGTSRGKHFVASWDRRDDNGSLETLSEFIQTDRKKLTEGYRRLRGPVKFQ